MALPVVIVHRNQPERCVRTVKAFLAQDVPVRLLVVDNGSDASAVSSLREALPDVEVVEAGANLGFSGGANVGFRRFLADPSVAGCEWIALAPHDALPAPGCLRSLLDGAAERPRAGLASAEFGDGAKPVVDPYFGGITGPQGRDVGWEDAGHPHGTLMLARRACLEQIGLFDERYFAYCEEADLALRARKAGWDVGVVWGAVVENPSLSVNVPAVDYLQLRNSLLLVRLHFGRYKAFIRLCFAVCALVNGLVRPSRRTYVFSPRGRLWAMADFLRRRFGPPPPHLVAR